MMPSPNPQPGVAQIVAGLLIGGVALFFLHKIWLNFEERSHQTPFGSDLQRLRENGEKSLTEIEEARQRARQREQSGGR